MDNKIESIISEFNIPGFLNISLIGNNEAVRNVDDKYIKKNILH